MSTIRRATTVAVLALLTAGAAWVGPAGAQEAPTTTMAATPPTTVAEVPTTVTTTVPPAPATTTTSTAPAPEATEAAPEAGRTISGTIKGVDGNFVNAQISLVLRDAQQFFIDINGNRTRPGPYADTRSINPTIPLEGSPSDTPGLTDTWSFTVPANAYDFTFEVYPRGPSSGATGNWSHYGGVSKRRVVIGSGLSDVRLRLPLNCDQPGGTTGSIQVLHNGGQVIDDFLALSENAPPSGIQGFRAQGTTRVQANPTFDGIAPDQRYSINAYVGSGHVLHTFYEVPVRSCRTTTLYAYTGASNKPPRWGTGAVSQRNSYFPIPGEFTGDTRDDVFWYSPSGPGDNLAISSGATGHFDTEVRSVGAGFRPVPGDFDADGIDDIFWYGPGAAKDRLWHGGQGGDFTVENVSAGGNTNMWPVAGDFDGNGHSDILFAEGGRLSTLRRYTDTGYTNGSAQVPANSAVRSGDVNGDFRDDLVWYNSATGQVQVWFGRADGTFAKVNEQVGANQGYRPILGDISGDFRADLIWYGPGSTKDSLWRGRASSSPYFAKESADLRVGGNYQPFTADLNGDGTEDIFWYAPGSAADTLWKMNLSGWIPQASP